MDDQLISGKLGGRCRNMVLKMKDENTGETNKCGIRWLEFANSYRLTVVNILFPNKLSRRTTWHAPNNKIHNQIQVQHQYGQYQADFILLARLFNPKCTTMISCDALCVSTLESQTEDVFVRLCNSDMSFMSHTEILIL